MRSTKLIVIGGSAAGAKAAARARRMDESADITIIQKDPDLSMAACGYPYYVGGVFDERNQLLSTPTGVVRGPEFFAKVKGITARTNTEVAGINREEKAILCRDYTNDREYRLQYDKLIIATGARPNLPPIANNHLQGITTLLSMKDADFLRNTRDEGSIKKAVVIGGGLIGLEACEALRLAGLEVTVVEFLDQVLPFLDWELAKLVENHMLSKRVKTLTSTRVKTFIGKDDQLTGVELDNNTILDCGLAVMATGVRPNTRLADACGLELGGLGGIKVNRFMQTSDPDIYAAGDCVEITNRFNNEATYSPMGDLANLEGRVAGENVINGNSAAFPGTNHTGICKVFDFAAGSTGLSEKAALKAAVTSYETVINASPDKPGFMGAKLLVSKMLINKENQQLLGYQCIGTGDVSRQLAMAAMAVQGKLTVDDLINADLPYAPPYSLAIDHFIASGHIMQNKLHDRMTGISTTSVWEKLQNKAPVLLLDTRSPEEYEEMRLGVGEQLIPLGALRTKLETLPADKDMEIICFCKISLRGYEAATILRAHGYTNVRVMEGGIMAWPYPKFQCSV